MDEQTAGQQEEQAAVESEAVSPANQLERFRGMREEIGTATILDLPIPGYQDQMGVRLHRLEWKVVREVARKVERSRNPLADLLAQVDTIIKATTCILVRPSSREEEWQEFTAPDSSFYLWDVRFAEGLGIPATSAREVLRGVFNNDVAISAFYSEYMEWIQGSATDGDEELLGE